ncbi:MAG TPA: cytochrome b/b6 domain-containing protein [Luteimonas sp.]|nr:cytochrome b/b6 domain-containing protein [Luteimonas sp.]HRO26236.1 cytochrome b/b6 domain-containing protein [Luteimonas sp.]HRP71207.1 cytochrome b/b6 domain-containing protein [Luteimonas sp.]
MTDRSTHTHFSAPARVLHWLVAALVIAMLFIGMAMVSTVSAARPWLLASHKAIGVVILGLVLVRLVVRWRRPPPPLPADLPRWIRMAAAASHIALYALMLTLPLAGWAMLSAAGDPLWIAGGMHLPPLWPVDAGDYAALRHLHRWLAWLLALAFLAHLGAALWHALIRRDGVFAGMVRRGPRSGAVIKAPPGPAPGPSQGD